MAFSQATIDAANQVARRYGFEPAAFLSVIEIESNGNPFEEDGKTPRFLFERHVFHRELKKYAPDRLKEAINAGLAIPQWDRKTQYKDQGNSAGRMALLVRARAIHAECANRSCSWGVGQTMGFLATEIGYASATQMVQMMATGIGSQLDAMARFIRSKGLKDKLNGHDWAGFALVYNGPGYRQNSYDTKLDAAFVRWSKRLNPNDPAIQSQPEPLPVAPVQNAEPQSIVKSPEAISGAVVAGSGAVSALSGVSGPIAYALAAVIVIGAIVGGYFLIKRIRAGV